MKILIAVDGSEYTQRMLDFVTSHRKLFDESHEYTVLTAVPAVPPRASSIIDKETLAGYYAEEAEKVLKPIREYLATHSLKASVAHKVGPPGEVISKTATAGGYELILMGSHGHSALGKLVMGSVTTNVLAHCGVPVLLVR